MSNSITDYAHSGAADYTEKDHIESALRYFVERVRAGEHINRAVLQFIAAGVEARLQGKRPWPATRGRRGALTARDFEIYHTFTIDLADTPKTAGKRDQAIARKFHCDERHVWKIVSKVQKKFDESATGDFEYRVWLLTSGRKAGKK